MIKSLVSESDAPPIFILPESISGVVTSTPCVPNIDLAACCKIRLIPHVASKLSISRPYSLETTKVSSNEPIINVTANAAIIETKYPISAASFDINFWMSP